MNHQKIIAEIKSFEKQLCKTYNCSIQLFIKIQKYSLHDIRTACEKVFKDEFKNEITLSKRDRNPKVVMLRTIYYKICQECDYGLTEMASFIGYDHASAHHNIKKITSRLEKDYSPAQQYYDKVKQELESNEI